ncbi:MAG: M28 family peptidase [Bryobacteraceae bacterium]|nr:M28 family peptidase [Bryobacteraceae bacterium]
MHRAKVVLIAMLAPFSAMAAEFSGASAFEFTRAAVAFGPRPPGSPASKKLQEFIKAKLKSFRCEIVDDAFTASTPIGAVGMANVIARFPGTSGRAVVFSGHYDTKHMPGIDFVGANDGGSSTGLLLELARVFSSTKRRHDVYLVWFDGEEAYVQYTGTDGFYGSRHLARRWEQDGTLKKILALINVDMIGDRDLGILKEQYSKASLNALIWKVAGELGYGRYFLNESGAVLDDHFQFVQKMVPAANLIDFDYGPNNSYWHTPKDTMDKLSPKSFEVVGRVLLEVLRRLEAPAAAAPPSAVPSR